jgi:hypothetical protein
MRDQPNIDRTPNGIDIDTSSIASKLMLIVPAAAAYSAGA